MQAKCLAEVADVCGGGSGRGGTDEADDDEGYRVTKNIKWCSGTNWEGFASNALGGHVGDPGCLIAPASLDAKKVEAGCESICDASSECQGFTHYAKTGECCFRAEISEMPACNDASCESNKCFEKPRGIEGGSESVFCALLPPELVEGRRAKKL